MSYHYPHLDAPISTSNTLVSTSVNSTSRVTDLSSSHSRPPPLSLQFPANDLRRVSAAFLLMRAVHRNDELQSWTAQGGATLQANEGVVIVVVMWIALIVHQHHLFTRNFQPNTPKNLVGDNCTLAYLPKTLYKQNQNPASKKSTTAIKNKNK